MHHNIIYVGINWADDHHDILITDDSAKTLNQFQINHTPEGFALLHENHCTTPKIPL